MVDLGECWALSNSRLTFTKPCINFYDSVHAEHKFFLRGVKNPIEDKQHRRK